MALTPLEISGLAVVTLGYVSRGLLDLHTKRRTSEGERMILAELEKLHTTIRGHQKKLDSHIADDKRELEALNTNVLELRVEIARG